MTDSKPPEQRDEQEDQQRGAALDEQAEMSEPFPPNILWFIGGIALFALVLGIILNWYIAPETSTQKKDLVQAMALIIAGAAGAVGIYFTWRGQRLAREAQENNQRNTLAQLENAQEQLRLAQQSQEDNQRNTQEQLKQAQKELDITRRGQMTERFTQAVDQLGSEKLEMRLGGIYSLERTARDSRSDHWPIMEVLSTYVRQHAPRKPGQESSEDRPTPEPDIQAILTVVGRRSDYHREGTFGDGRKIEDGPINLHDTDLRGADLGGAHLKSAVLAGADLRGASLAGAHLQHAIVEDADLRGANLWGADLRHVYFFADTLLQDAVLNEADLRAADLSRATELTQEQLDNALGDSQTVVPHGLRRPALWALEVSEQRSRQRQLFEQALESAAAELRPPDELSNEED
jgi:hypothetical protein